MYWLEQQQSMVRLLCFLGVLVAMLCWEHYSPKRQAQRFFNNSATQTKRRISNLALSFFNTLVLQLLPLVSATAAALWANTQGLGLFNSITLPSVVVIVSGVLLLDMAIYWQHRLMHTNKTLWRLHKVHHSDPDFDTTTALRFHPIEIIISMLYKMFWVIALGLPVYVVILFELILNAAALFNHGNTSLPPKLERRLRKILVTPDMHRIHHSTKQVETDSNYGFFVSFWDRLFGSYTAKAELGDQLTIGLDEYQSSSMRKLSTMLTLPFRRT